MSVAVACPISTGVLIAIASAVLASGTVNTGFVVSTIVISCFAVETLPFSSVAVHVTVVVPSLYFAGASFVITTLNISLAVAPPILTGVSNPIASAVTGPGTTSTGFVVSVIVIICSAVETFPFASVAVHLTVVIPTG